MKEYIGRAQLLKNLGYDETRRADVLPGSTFDIVLKEPAADVAEVRHGRWERVSTASGIISRVRCSVCAGTQPLTFENMPYCPTCGARMDEEDGHEIS